MNDRYNLDSNNVKDIWPLTSMQEGLLYHYLSNPNRKQYLIQMSFKISGNLNSAYVKEAWKAVIASNDMLRVVFRYESISRPVQIVLYKKEVPIRFISVNEEERSEQFLNEFKKNDIEEGIDIRTNPFRLSIIYMKKQTYYMIITFHHILFDGWSNSIIWKEFLSHYTSLCKNEPIIISEKRSFKDYINWIDMQDTKSQRSYWSEYLKGICISQIKGDKVNNVIGGCNKKMSYLYTFEQSQKITSFMKQRHLTQAAFFYTIWGMIIKIFTDTDDVVFGTTVSGRNGTITGIENMVGMFINTIPLRIQFSDRKTIGNLLRNVHDMLICRQEYENMPLIQINEYCDFREHNTIFDTIVIIENYPVDVENSQFDLIFDSIYEYTEYNLAIQIDVLNNLSVTLCYNASLYSSELVKRILDLFVNLIDQTIVNDMLLLDELEMKSYVDENQIRDVFNNTSLKYDKTLTIPELLKKQVIMNKDKSAIIFGSTNLLYEQLDKISDVIASYLLARNLNKGSIIGLLVDQSPNMLIGIFGILKAGCTYLPLDRIYPDIRIDYMLKDSGACLLLTERRILSAEYYGIECLYMDDINGDNLIVVNKPDIDHENTAYIIYTSGSTGKPKGVGISHRAVNNFIHGMREIIPFYSSNRIINLTTISFDIFVLETILPIASGMTVVIGREKEHMDPAILSQDIEQYHIDMIQLTPSRLRLIVNSGIDLHFMKRLKVIMIGGEPFPNELYETLRLYTDAAIYNMYGPTETTVWSTVKKIVDVNEIDLGKPIANTIIYIMGKNKVIKPIGAFGEICIGGDGVFNGYHGKKELTDQKMMVNPFDREKYIYRTGDVGRWSEDGNIQCIGRVDYQVKLRGYRIELEEIEICLLDMNGIKEAVVDVLKDRDNNEHLCAFIVSDIDIAHEDIVNFLERKLPQYMIPSFIQKMNNLPRTHNGKLNRNELKMPEMHVEWQYYQENELSELEMQLIDLWKSVLPVEHIHLNDRFFDIGGNSLLLMRLYAKFNIEYPGLFKITDLYSNSTIEKQVMFIRDSKQLGMNKVKHRNYVNVDRNLWFKVSNEIVNKKYESFRYETNEKEWEVIKMIALKYNMCIEEMLLSIFVVALSEYVNVELVSFDAIMNFGKITNMEIDLSKYEELEDFLSDFTSIYHKSETIIISELDDEIYNEKGISIVWYDANKVNDIDLINKSFDISIGIMSNYNTCGVECAFSVTDIKMESVLGLFKYYITYIQHIS